MAEPQAKIKLDEFLQKYKTKDGEVSTHLRIPNQALGIYGGKWNITKKADLENFNKIYHRKVFELGLSEYLTETQDRKNGGPVYLDLDFKYMDIDKRQHDSDIINDIIETYIQHLSNLIDLESGFKDFKIWVFEKDKINKLKEKKPHNGTWFDSKDGIHMIFEIKMPHDMQLLLRSMVLTTIEDEVLDALRPQLINSPEDIIDKSISSGSTGIQMYGSKKPGGEPYKLTDCYKITFNEGSSQFEIVMSANDTTGMLDKAKKSKHLALYFSTRTKFQNYKAVKINKSLKQKYLEHKKKKKEREFNNQISNKLENDAYNLLYDQGVFERITSEEELLKYIKIFILDSNNQELISAHKYTLLLDDKYYEPYNIWFKVGQALHSVGNELMLTYALWSSQSESWNWEGEKMRMIKKYWNDISQLKQCLITIGSIKYWAGKEHPIEYKKIYDNSVKYHMNETLFGEGTEYDLARLCYFMYKDKYACVSLKGQGEWWEFNSLLKPEYTHCWTECETGTSLRRKLSSQLSTLYIDEERETTDRMKTKIRLLATLKEQGADINQIKVVEKQLAKVTKSSAIYNNIAIKLKKTTNKAKIMTECKDEFREPFLLDKLDSNPYTMCFNNGVYDFKSREIKDENNKVKYEGEFRMGYPEDYISKSTRIEFIKPDYDNNEEHKKIKEEIDNFMATLFVEDSLREYMWNHLASALIGVNIAQTFNIYYGGGSNGKSMLVKFMKVCLGDYAKIDVPLSLITQKRVGVGDTSPEIAALKGIRFAVMQEASKGDTINDGIMKQLTGGDVLTGRHLFKDPIAFVPQFTLCLCLNVMPTINSNDGGTWRRIRKVDYDSTFVDTRKHRISTIKADKQFPMDRNLEDNFTRWAPIMMWHLIQISQNNLGDVLDCDKVLEASQQYREREDYLEQFYKDKIENTGNNQHVVSKTGIKVEFRNWWQQERNGQSPRLTELIDYLDKKFDPLCRNIKEYRGWRMKQEWMEDDDDDLSGT